MAVREEKRFCTIFKQSPGEKRVSQALMGVDSTKRELIETKKELEDMTASLSSLMEEVKSLRAMVEERETKTTKSTKKSDK